MFLNLSNFGKIKEQFLYLSTFFRIILERLRNMTLPEVSILILTQDLIDEKTNLVRTPLFLSLGQRLAVQKILSLFLK